MAVADAEHHRSYPQQRTFSINILVHKGKGRQNPSPTEIDASGHHEA